MPLSRRAFSATGLAFLGTSMFMPVQALAKSLVFGNRRGAIRGYDPVAYFKVGKPVKGKKKFRTEWKGTTWSFSSAGNLAAFKKSPEKFAPAYGGYCSWAMSQGRVATTVPEAWDIVDGKLYLNFSLGVRDQWRENIPRHIKKANRHWPKVKKTLA